jgi:membrane protease YdiL (CAAX protease family)
VVEIEPEPAPLSALRGVAEPLLVLGLAFLLILALSAAFVPDELPETGGDRPEFRDLVREQPRMVPVFLAIQATVLLVGGLLMMRWRVPREPSAGRQGALRAALVGVGGGIAAIGASAVLSGLLALVGWPVQEQPWLQELLLEPVLIRHLAPWIVVAAPIAEEVFFRGYMLRFMERRLGFRAALLLSSLVFAVIHLNPSGLPVYLVIAVVMALVYHYSGNLISPIVAHATLNGTILLASALVPASGTIFP